MYVTGIIGEREWQAPQEELRFHGRAFATKRPLSKIDVVVDCVEELNRNSDHFPGQQLLTTTVFIIAKHHPYANVTWRSAGDPRTGVSLV